MFRVFLLISFALLLPCTPTVAVEHVVLQQNGTEVSVSGRLLVTAEDNGMLLLSADGVLWLAPPEDLVKHKHDDEPLKPLSFDELGEQLRQEVPGFEIHATQHYLICHNTSRAYAQWCGALFERLYKAFTNFWTRKDFELHEPEFPLVAMVFADKPSYAAYARRYPRDASENAVGLYSVRLNRMMMYDLTGVETVRAPGDKRSSAAQINQMLSRPEAAFAVATIIHEATHQIAYNCGLQTRYADIPLWFNEGLATYFETPDLSSSKGWRTIGAVNPMRLTHFREYQAKHRPVDSLLTLVSTTGWRDDANRKNDPYAEAWALTYFLMRQRPKQYLAYVKMLSEKKPLIFADDQTRLREFQQAFGDVKQLDTEFVRQMAKVR